MRSKKCNYAISCCRYLTGVQIGVKINVAFISSPVTKMIHLHLFQYSDMFTKAVLCCFQVTSAVQYQPYVSPIPSQLEEVH